MGVGIHVRDLRRIALEAPDSRYRADESIAPASRSGAEHSGRGTGAARGAKRNEDRREEWARLRETGAMEPDRRNARVEAFGFSTMSEQPTRTSYFLAALHLAQRAF
jgi:hypothetical protein